MTPSQPVASTITTEKTDDSSAMPRQRIRPVVFILLLLILASLFLLSLAVGSVQIPLEDILRVLLGGEASKSAWTQIILSFRLPGAVTAMLAGAALGVSGLMMQTLFRNPLAGPFVLGVSSGASLGVALVVLASGSIGGGALIAGLGITGDLMLALAAGLGAGLMMAIILFVARQVQSSTTLLILGLMFGYLTTALVSLLLFFSIADRIQAYINWTFGNFNGVTWSQMIIFAPLILVGLLVAFLLSKSLNALLLGENYARSMGLAVRQVRFWIVAVTALLAGTVTAFAGPIGFIGIAVPHLCRSLFNSSNHFVLMPATMLVGAIVALLSALIAAVPGSDLVLPLNAVTSILGAPVVIWVILRRRRLRRSIAI